MSLPGMRITLDAAMRARDVSRPRPEGEEPPPPKPQTAAKPTEPHKPTKVERRRQGKRSARKPDAC